MLCIEWKDNSTSWETLASVKGSNPLEVVEYATAHGIEDEPAFSWWVPYAMKKRYAIISSMKMKSRALQSQIGNQNPKICTRCLEILTGRRMGIIDGRTLYRRIWQTYG
jgi:hypothetical protein